MFINTIVDEINLKNMPEVIIDFFRKNGEKKFNNLRNFYDNLLKYVSEDIRDSYLNRILKYLSSSNPILINIIEDFKLDVYDKELKDFSNYLVDEINKYDDYKDLYESLNRKVNYIFYDKEDYLNIKESHNVEDYKTFIFLLLKHTFYTYQINIPGIVSTRLYEEAITMIYDSETRKNDESKRRSRKYRCFSSTCLPYFKKSQFRGNRLFIKSKIKTICIMDYRIFN